MRPPVLCGGTAEFHYDWEVMQRGFNEAPGFMWGKYMSRTATYTVIIGFNEAPGFMRGKWRIRFALVNVDPASFNEAPGFVRGKSAAAQDVVQKVCASMRPPDLCGGNGDLLAAICAFWCRFSEAPGFMRGKYYQRTGKCGYLVCFNEAPGFMRGKYRSFATQA